MLDAFKIKSRAYSETPDTVFQPIGVYGSREQKNRNIKNNTNINKSSKPGSISSDYDWLIK
jgi:hypothetical protein